MEVCKRKGNFETYTDFSEIGVEVAKKTRTRPVSPQILGKKVARFLIPMGGSFLYL